MAEIPQYLARISPESGSGTPEMRISGKGRGLSILGQGLSEAASNVASIAQNQFRTEQHLQEVTSRQQAILADLQERKTRQVEALQGKRLISQLRTDWNNRLIEFQQNPVANLLSEGQDEYDKYVTKLLEGMPSENVRNEVSLHAAEYRIGYLNDLFRLQSQQQLQEFGSTFDSMVSNAEDSIFSTKSLAEVQYQKELLNSTIEDAVALNQIKDKSIVQNLRDKVDLLSISWANSMLPDNPEMVKQVIGNPEMSPGLTSQHRATILAKADDVVKTKDNQSKMLLREALESDLNQRTMTGQGESLDIQQFRSVYGDVAADAAERDLANATKLYEYTQRAMGASEETLQQLEKEVRPKEDPTSPRFAEQQDLADKVDRFIKQVRSDKDDDAFSYFSANPTVKNLLDDYRTNPTVDSSRRLRDAVLDLQKMDSSLQPYQYKVMPKAEAEKFIEDFNKLIAVGSKADGDSVLQNVLSFTQRFGDKTNIALSQLNQTQGGDKIASKINPLMWHIGNPTTFRLIVDAIRKDPQEQYQKFESDKVRQNFLQEVRLDPNMMSYMSSMQSSNNGADSTQLIDGVRQTYRDFARDYVLNGGDMRDASTLFFSNYTWGSKNGTTYARPRVYSDSLGKEHVMSEEQISLSNSYLEFWPQALNPEQIEPATIVNQTEGFNEKEITRDVATALRGNTFWSTTEDETGVYLFTKGSIFGEPKQVFWKNGTPVRVNFIDTMKSIEMTPYGERKSRYPDYTGDSIWDRIANMFGRSG